MTTATKNGTAAAVAEPTPREAKRLEVFEEWEDLGPGFEVAVTREVPGSPGGQYLEILPREDAMNIELLRERYGGGKFSMRLRDYGQFA